MELMNDVYVIGGTTPEILELLRRNKENNICPVCGKSGFFNHELRRHIRENHPSHYQQKRAATKKARELVKNEVKS
jgi:hypothetical protein